MFRDKIDIKERKITYLATFLIEMDNKTLTELILGE